jgi:hypothetical protein
MTTTLGEGLPANKGSVASGILYVASGGHPEERRSHVIRWDVIPRSNATRDLALARHRRLGEIPRFARDDK